MPASPQDPKQAFDEITRTREQMIAEEKARAEKRASDEKELAARQSGAFLEEAAATKVRAEKREEWRLDRHAEKLALEEEKRKKELEKMALEAQRAKKDAAAAKQAAQMDDLHRKAVEKRTRERVEGARDEEEKRKNVVTTMQERRMREIDEEARRTAEHITREERRKKELLQNAAARTRIAADEALRLAKIEATRTLNDELRTARDDGEKRDARMRETQALSKARTEYNRATAVNDESLQRKIFDIGLEAKKLRDEAMRAAAEKSKRIVRDADRERADARTRRESVESAAESARLHNRENEGEHPL